MTLECGYDQSSVNFNALPSLLETEPSVKRERVGRHMAEAVLFDGFTPLEKPVSKFEPLREQLNEKIIDQPRAIDAIIAALDKESGRNENDPRPKAVLAFLGPTGLGKSQTAKELANFLGKKGSNLIKIDCSSFSHGHEVATLTGSPPGYAGAKITPILNKHDVEKRGTVILVDEIEKSAQELHNLFLQVFGDGELTLSNGDKVSFKNSIIIITSNVGASEMNTLTSDRPVGFATPKPETDKKVLDSTVVKAFEKFFKPEFVNRIDEVVVFHPLSKEGMERVLDLRLREINARYEDELGIRVSLSKATIEHLVDIASQQPNLGVRPLVRAFESRIQTELGRYVDSGNLGEGTHLRVFHRNDIIGSYLPDDDRELIFSAKHDRTIKRKAGKELMAVKHPIFPIHSIHPVVRVPKPEPPVW
jgi:ATP-dependent Clp protease ATP-binding subunit ClpA